ncbi:MAG: hypothetical protein D6730_14155 [Bacteroidetes bacterium]|nr:MAG: hypothetical protein D6730_14155 [Bacteroidota bacterium]
MRGTFIHFLHFQTGDSIWFLNKRKRPKGRFCQHAGIAAEGIAPKPPASYMLLGFFSCQKLLPPVKILLSSGKKYKKIPLFG